MSTKRTRQLGKDNYIAAEDIQHIIYDSDEENSSEILSDEQAETRETYNSKSLKPGLSSDKEIKSSKYRGRLYDSLDIWCSKPIGNKLNSSSSNVNEKKSILNLLESNTERGSSIDFRNTKENIGDKLSNLDRTESNNECLFSNTGDENLELLTEENICFLASGRKRILDQDLDNINFNKKFKVEIDKNMSDTPGYNLLQVELELKNNCKNKINEKRSIESIINELELLHRKLKENVENYNSPVIWGRPIIKQCSEKWDTHYIPQKVIERYQKHLEVSPSSSSSFQSKNFETSSEGCDSRENQITEAEGSRNPDKGLEEGCDIECCSEPPNSDVQMDEIFTRFDPEIQGGVSSKNRNLNRQQEERVSNNSANDSYVIGKLPEILSSKSNKGKKCNKRTVAEPERSNDPTSKYQNEDNIDSNKNFEKYKVEDLDRRVTTSTSSETHSEEKASAGTARIIEEEQVVCPICDIKFDIEKIVAHASHCATKTFRD